MDDFAKEYFDKLKQIAPDFYGKRGDLAESRIRMFVACLYRQLTEFNETYDLIVGAGNSGLFMTKITEMTYDDLKIKKPLVINLPIYRFQADDKTINDNIILLDILKGFLEKNGPIKNVLFVDDEIMKGITARISFDLILKINPATTHFDATIIAENHFFEWHYKFPQISLKFFSYSPLIQGLNGNIGYFIPQDLYESLSKIFPQPFSHNHAMAIVVGGGLKQREADGKQFFNFKLSPLIESKIPQYTHVRASLLDRLKNLVHEGIVKYKSGEIKFRF